MSRPGPILALILAAGLAVGAAGCSVDVASICQAAGGTYTGDTCTRSGEQAAEDACAAGGGVYLAGQDRCEIGSGGP